MRAATVRQDNAPPDDYGVDLQAEGKTRRRSAAAKPPSSSTVMVPQAHVGH